ncbi:YbhB/YbcL family Raf kinase inhibitor-like protein [uncultured Methanospirillum sp.]|uniref:YbhB/YbcL family Raf kinase inhibitor-like protein n=1 Tax=uncultured Methanospirillum sp. TaxID=262503 RepID=UPI0029C6D070|nr:YbhB/YbcL family Raf kinase inhibitor-like protein [uncultured Methanospirillum sp.]
MHRCCPTDTDANIQDMPIHPLTVSLDYFELPNSATFQGGNISPAISLTGLEPGTVSIAVMVFNPFIKTCCSFTPWIIWNIAPLNRIPAGIPSGQIISFPISAVQGLNDYGETGYHGPEPSLGEMHRYQFRIYALDSMLTIPGGSSKDELISAMKGHVLQYGETVAISTG